MSLCLLVTSFLFPTFSGKGLNVCSVLYLTMNFELNNSNQRNRCVHGILHKMLQAMITVTAISLPICAGDMQGWIHPLKTWCCIKREARWKKLICVVWPQDVAEPHHAEGYWLPLLCRFLMFDNKLVLQVLERHYSVVMRLSTLFTLLTSPASLVARSNTPVLPTLP
jgi:hypothetical protein